MAPRLHDWATWRCFVILKDVVLLVWLGQRLEQVEKTEVFSGSLTGLIQKEELHKIRASAETGSVGLLKARGKTVCVCVCRFRDWNQ